MHYFLSRSNRFYSFIIHQKIWHLYASTFILCVFLGIAWFFCCYRLMHNKIISKKQLILDAEHTMQTINDTKKKCAHLADTIQTFKKKACLNKNSLHNRHPLTIITNAAHKAGSTLSHCTLLVAHTKKEIVRQNVSCQFLATTDQMIAFFDFLYTHKVAVKCIELKMQAVQKKGEGSNAKKPLYDVQCTLKIYVKKAPQL